MQGMDQAAGQVLENGAEAIADLKAALLRQDAPSGQPLPPSDPKCGCDYPLNVHLNDLGSFVKDLRKAIPSIMAPAPAYDKVQALVVHWQNTDIRTGNVDHLKERAETLEKVFKDDYKFDTTLHPLPDENAQLPFNALLNNIALSISEDSKKNLLILYYGGHGAQDENGAWIWQPKEKTKINLKWSKVCWILQDVECDILFLFDCCHALGMVDEDYKWRRRCEIFASCGPFELAGADKDHSFTTAVTTELAARKDSAGISVGHFRTILTSNAKLETYGLTKAMPQYRKLSKKGNTYRSSILLVKQKSPGQTDDGSSTFSSASTVKEWQDMTEARVLIKVAFSNPSDKQVVEQWLRWFRDRPPNLAELEVAVVKQVQVESFFKSGSSLAMISMPIWLWDSLPSNPAYEYVGIARSDNLLPFLSPRAVPLLDNKVEYRPTVPEKSKAESKMVQRTSPEISGKKYKGTLGFDITSSISKDPIAAIQRKLPAPEVKDEVDISEERADIWRMMTQGGPTIGKSGLLKPKVKQSSYFSTTGSMNKVSEKLSSWDYQHKKLSKMFPDDVYRPKANERLGHLRPRDVVPVK